MSFNGFFYRLLGLFSDKPLCRKLVRSERYQQKYIAWKNSPACAELTAAFYKAYHYKRAGIQCSYRVQLIEEQHRQGIILFHDPTLSPESFSYLFDYLKEQVLQQGYRLRSADRRKVKHESYKQHTEAYNLTPYPQDIPGSAVCNQLYGNILIDYTRVNYHPGYIRFIADSFADTHFSQPLPFSQLLESVLRPTEK